MINLITSILMISALGLSVPHNKVHYDYYDNGNYEYIEIEKPKEKLVSYDDEEYYVTLTSEELKNYHFENLYEQLETYYQDYEIYSGYLDPKTSFDGISDYTYYSDFNVGDNSIATGQFIFSSNYNVYLSGMGYANSNNIEFVNYHFYYVHEVNGDIALLTDENYAYWQLNIGYDEGLYDDLKQAIEADISANSSPSYQNILVEALELLTGGLTTIAAALGSGMAAYVEGLLISGTSMSAFASVIFMFGGIALAFALGRWVVNFIGSLGKRNR